jgi:iron complex transport system ATP-binding protein
MIKAKDLNISFSGIKVINGISFDIREAEYISIIGPNGAGKSTILKSLCRICPCDSGEVFVTGKNIRDCRQKDLAKEITYIAQLPTNDFTVKEFILMSRYPYFTPFSGMTKKDIEICSESMRITFTSEFADRKLTDLSSGERQRVAIASALAQKTEIILFDEPVTHLDPYFDHEISELIYKIHKEKNITVINATHNLNNALKYSDRIMAVSEGKIVFFKEPSNISSSDMKELFKVDFISLENPSDKKTLMIRV